MTARAIPMFPLGTVLLPYAMLPLHVFEPRYRLMTKRVLETDYEFGVVLIERGSEVGGGDVRFDVGTIARVVQAAQLPDGRYSLATVGLRRFRVSRWLPDDPYPQAEIEDVVDASPTPAEHEARNRVEVRLDTLIELAQRFDPRITERPPLDDDPVRASFEAAALAGLGPLDAQRVLEAHDTATRLAYLDALLAERAEELRARLEGDLG
jgi:Lon protease-like protein